MADFGIDGSANTNIVEAAIQPASQGIATFPITFDNNSASTTPIGFNLATPPLPGSLPTGVGLPKFGPPSVDDLILPPPLISRRNLEASDTIDISGSSGDDQITGSDSNNIISGGPGNDVIDGGQGDDVILLGDGKDQVTGGAGSDGFALPSQGVSDPAQASRIVDFDASEGDTLLLPEGVSPEDLIYESDDQDNTLVRLPDGSTLVVLEGVDPSELADIEGDGGPVRSADEQLDNQPSGAKDLGILGGGPIAEGQLSNRDTKDLFKFRVETPTLLDSILTPANGSDVELSLYADNNQDNVLTADEQLASTADDQGGTDSIENYLMQPGNYYLSVDITDPPAQDAGQLDPEAEQTEQDSEQPFSTSYTLNLSGTQATEARDTAGNDFASAADLGAFTNQEINESLSSADPADIYRIEVPEGDYFEANLGGALGESVSLLLVKDSNGDGSVGEDEVVEAGTGSLTAVNLEAGSYYLALVADDGAQGSYQLDLAMGGGSPVEEEVLAPLIPDEPTLGKVSRKSQVDPLNANRRFEEYAISDLAAGDRLSLLVSSPDGVPKAELIDPVTQEVRSTASPVPDSSSSRIDFTIPDQRNYVVRVYSPLNADLDYRLDLTDVSDPVSSDTPVDPAPADSPVTDSPSPRTRQPRNTAFLGTSVDPSGKKPDPQFVNAFDAKNVRAYVLDYRQVDPTKVGLVGPNTTDLGRARISDIQQGALGDCAFLAAVAALFGRVNPNPGQGLQGRSSVAQKPSEASSQALQSIFKPISSQAYSFGFYPDNKKSKQPEFVQVDSAILTLQKAFSLPTKSYTNFGDGNKVRLSGEGFLEIVDKTGKTSTVGLSKNREAYFKALQKVNLTTVQAVQNSANNTNTSLKTPFAAAFPKTLNANGQPIDKTTTGTTWVNAIERAYASWRSKGFGGSDGYSIIGQGDWMNNTLARLTGRKTVTKTKWQNKELFNSIDQALSRGDFVGASAPASSSKQNPALVGRHAYAVTDVYNAGTATNPQYRIVVFNPHGRDGTTEPDPKNIGGHPTAKPKLLNQQSSPINDGFIDLSIGEFNKYFQSVTWTQKDGSAPTQKSVLSTSTLQPQPQGGVAPAKPAEFLTLTSRADRFSIPAPKINTPALGKIRALQGNDTIEGSAGNDEVFGNQGADVINGRAGDDRLWGGQGKDRLYGNQGNDLLRGEQGNDLLVGGKGNDTLGGGLGNDVLVGSEGTDSLTGGRGADVFALLSPFAVQDVNKADRITDFSAAEGDRIALTDRLTGDSVVLESAGKATVIRLKSNNAILGVVDNAAPADLRDRFTTYSAALKALKAL